MVEIGTVKWFDGHKGYGFIQREEAEDVFVHFSSIKTEGHKSLEQGDKVSFDVEKTERGLRAINVVKLSAEKGYHRRPEHMKATSTKVYKGGLFHERHKPHASKKEGIVRWLQIPARRDRSE